MIKEITDSIFRISSNSVRKIESLSHIIEVKKNEVFIEKGRKNEKEYFLLEGICKSYVVNPEGEEITISFFQGGSTLSPYMTRTKGAISTLNFKALSDLKLSVIDQGDFEKLMVNNLEIRRFGNAVLRNELSQKVEKEIGMASLTAKERLLAFRSQYPKFENQIPHTDIASYLGITNISLSRLRKELSR